MLRGIAEFGQGDGSEVPGGFASTESLKLWLSQRFADVTDPARLLDIVCSTLGEHMQLARVCYGETGDDPALYTIAHDWTKPGIASIAGTHRLDPEAWVAGQYRLGRTLAIDDVRHSALAEADAARLEASGIRAFIGVPLVNAGRLVALFRATDDAPRAWRSDEVSIVSQTGARLWAALEHLRLTEKLRESEQQFRLLAENLPGLCWVTDPDGTIRWGNALWHEMFDGTGGAQGDASDVVHPDDLALAMSLWQSMREGAYAAEVQLRLRGRDGIYRPFLSKAVPVRDAGGAVVRWCGVQIDLSEKQALDRRQAILRAFHDRTRDLIDPEEILSVLSDTLTANFGINHLIYAEAPEGDPDRLSVFHARDGVRVRHLPLAAFRAAFEHLAATHHWDRSRVVDDNLALDRAPGDPAAAVAAQMGVRSGINVPIIKEGRLVAALTLLHGEARHWSREDVELCEELSERVWATVSRARAETALRERERNQAFLIEWNDEVRSTGSPAAIMALTLERLGRHLGVSRTTNAETKDEGRHFSVTAEWRTDVVSILGAHFSIESVGASVDRQWSAGELICYEDVPNDPRLEDAAKQVYVRADIRAFVSVPFVQDGHMRSALSVQHDAPRRWSESEIALIREIAQRTWVALDRARALIALQERERSQQFLIEWSDRLRGETSSETVLAETLERLGKHLGTSRANFAECDGPSGRFQVLWEWCADGPARSRPEDRQGVSDGIHQEHIAGRIVIVEDVLKDERFDDEARQRYVDVDAQAFLAIPLVSNDQVRAVLSVQQGSPRAWQESDVQLLRDVAERTWTILELARAERALKARERVQAFLVAWNDSIRNESSPHAILGRTLRQLGEHLGVWRVNFAEMNAAGDALTVLQEWQSGSEPGMLGQVFPLAALGEKVMAAHVEGSALIAHDVATDPRFDETRDLYLGIRVHAALTLPMIRGGRLVAVLSAQHTEPRTWSESDVELMREVAERTLNVVERAKSEERLAESEAQLAAFMEHAPVVMYLKDVEGRYIRINPEFAKAMGRPIEELTGALAADMFAPDVAARLQAIGERAMAGEVMSAEVDIGLGTGHPYDSIFTMAFPIPGNGRARTAGFALDLTERRRAEAALARSREALYQSEKISALGSLLAGVSHELNNPLSIVVAQAVMMERQAKGTELAERAAKIRKAADRCARIVQTFLAMARQKRPERAAVDLNAVTMAAHELADYGLKTDGIVTVREFAPRLPLISADSDQLHQVIINLIVNAQQAMVEAGLPERTLTLRTALGADGHTVVLDVADTGPGVPDEARRRIFEPFYTTKPQGQGTGVGLSFSQGLAEAHGGRLELVPTAVGACFRLTLPISENLTLGTGGESEVPAAATPARRALVIDDEEEIAESLAEFLAIEGFECEIAVGGAAAQGRLRSGAYDLIVSDLRMPEVDGPQLFAWIAANRPDLRDRVAFATGDTLGIAAERFLHEAKRPVLEKPFMPDAVHRFLEQMDLA